MGVRQEPTQSQARIRTGFAHVLVALEVIEDDRRVRRAVPPYRCALQLQLDACSSRVRDVTPLQVCSCSSDLPVDQCWSDANVRIRDAMVWH